MLKWCIKNCSIVKLKLCNKVLIINIFFTISQVAYVGDSEADEYAISRLKGVAYTFRVINEDATVITRTSANYRLEGSIFYY